MYKRIYGLSMYTNIGYTSEYMGLAYRLTQDAQANIWA